jgi:hypothetical protein
MWEQKEEKFDEDNYLSFLFWFGFLILFLNQCMFNFAEVMKPMMILLYFWAKVVYVQRTYMECKLYHFGAIIPCINPSKADGHVISLLML